MKPTIKDSIRNQIASIQAEGFTFTKQDYELANRVGEGEISIDEAIAEVKEKYGRS